RRCEKESPMSAQVWSRRDLLKAVPGVALAAHARPAFAQAVKWSAGAETPKLKAPANATDCHHHIYDAKYPVDPKATLRPADAGRRLPRAPEAHRDHAQRARPAVDVRHGQPLSPRRARRLRVDRPDGGRLRSLRRHQGGAADVFGLERGGAGL